MELMYFLTMLMFTNWMADFFLQNDWMALKKSEDISVLAIHCIVYSLVMTIGFCIFASVYFPLGITALVYYGERFFALMYISHFAIDYVTSRMNKKLWMNNQRHWFFVMVGFDQFLHIATILWFIGFYFGKVGLLS